MIEAALRSGCRVQMGFGRVAKGSDVSAKWKVSWPQSARPIRHHYGTHDMGGA